jgi:aspartyl-tRNA(Asn)/glutamyl-tRNA(Gln) amidotransferase subunit B
MLKLMDSGVISGKIAKTVFEEMYATGRYPEAIVKEKGLVQVTDAAEIEKVVETVLAANPEAVEDYKKGKIRLVGFFVGEIMKKTKGKANPRLVNEILAGMLRK